MNFSVLSIGISLICCILFLGKNKRLFQTPDEKINGLTFVAVPDPFEKNPMDDIKKVHANWIAIVPYAFIKQNSPEVRYNAKWQWWGEKPEGITETIKLAKAQGLKIMYKPQIYIQAGWVGDMDFATEEEWKIWEQTYQEYIFTHVKIAVQLGVEMFCVGTELNKAALKRETFWRELIRKVRKEYKGKITYSTNWDFIEPIKFWDGCDYIGISAYFPLREEKTPKIEDLIKAWQPVKQNLKDFSKLYKKKILFTEYGYLSVDGCAGKLWEIEKIVTSLPVNEMAQANAIDALFHVYYCEDFWAGSFLWKWFPNGQGHEGYIERDYTPQHKEAEKILVKWFRK